MYKMIVKDNQDTHDLCFQLPNHNDVETQVSPLELNNGYVCEFQAWLDENIRIFDKKQHEKLQEHLIENVWRWFATTCNPNKIFHLFILL